MGMDLKELKALLRLMEGNDVEELEVEEGGRRVRIRRRTAAMPMTAPAVLPAAAGARSATAAAAPGALPAAEGAGLIPVESPMVGTFYRAPAPGAEPYVKEGNLVEKGTVLCIIEAMKLMNEIEAEVSGVLAKMFVSNGNPVEYGMPLFGIRKQ